MTDDLPPALGAHPTEPDWAALLQVVGIAVARVTPQGVVTGYNAVSARLLGWDIASGLGHSLTDLVIEHPDGVAADSFGRTLGAGRPWAGVMRIARPEHGGSSVPATAVPLHDEDGQVVGAVVLGLEADSAIWPLLTGYLDGWLVLRGSGQVSYASPQATRLLGRTGPDLGMVGVAAPDHPEIGTLGAVLARHMSGDARDVPIEFRVVDGDGLGRWIEAVITGKNAGGPLEGVRWRLRDVTGRRRLDGRHEARSTELQAALESRVVIEQAKGFLAGRDGDTPDVAFRRLRRHARDHNLELREVARRLMSGELMLESAG